jgi:DNA mismatch repair ATPase MutL
MVDSSTLQPRIRPLDQQCINRIAAGEVIHRPASAVRDPLLNSGLSMDAALTHLC